MPHKPSVAARKESSAVGGEKTTPEAVEMAVRDVRADDSDTNWLLINYEGRGNGELALRDLGNDGLEGMLAAMPEGKVSFGLLRYEAGDHESRRIKFVGLTYIAPGTPPLAKARVSMQKDACEKVFGQLHVQMLSDDLADLAPDKVASKAGVAAGGAIAGGYKKSSVVGAANGGGVRKPLAMPRAGGGGAAAEIDPAKQVSAPSASTTVDSSAGSTERQAALPKDAAGAEAALREMHGDVRYLMLQLPPDRRTVLGAELQKLCNELNE